MASTQAKSFATLLRGYRVRAELSQEQLAERALMSGRGISDLERGLKRTPREYTVQALADALNLSAEERAEFEGTVVRVRTPREEVGTAVSVPSSLTPFVGRQREIAALSDLLQQPEIRLITLTGPGGTGKTRLALRVLDGVREVYRSAFAYVELAAVDDPALVVPAIAHALGVKESGDRALMASLQTRIGQEPLLLILDNFEQVLGAVPRLAELLVAGPRLTLLVTSRSALHLPGEYHFPVPPLGLPDPHLPSSLDTLIQSDAAALFVQRAQAADTNFRLTAENAAAVAEVCARLDGLPLAIELAAARTRALPLSAILTSLRGRDSSAQDQPQLNTLRVLKAEFVGVPLRHQTLRNAIEWSYDLLDPDERELFARLAIFSGGCTLDAAEVICNPNHDMTVDLLDGVASLVDKSLLRRVDSASGEARFAMLHTMRQYAAERLEAGGQAAEFRQRHEQYYLELAEEAASAITGPAQAEWLDRLDEEHDNLRSAIGRSAAASTIPVALRLAVALWRFWLIRGYWIEGRRWLEELLVLGIEAEPQLRAPVLSAAGHLAWRLGDYDQASTQYHESLSLYRAVNDEAAVAQTLDSLAIVAASEGNNQQAAALQEESLAISRALGNERGIARSLNNLGIVASNRGEYERATALFEESLALKRKLKDILGIAGTLANLGFVVQELGRLDQAAALYQESLVVFRALNDRRGIGRSLADLATIKREQGAFHEARQLIAQSLELFQDISHSVGIAQCLEILAQLAAAEGQSLIAAQLFGAADAARDALRTPLPAIDRATNQRYLAAARAMLDDANWTTAWRQGHSMSLDEATRFALTTLRHSRSGSPAF